VAGRYRFYREHKFIIPFVEADHAKHDGLFSAWISALTEIADDVDIEVKKQKGYQFYLSFREFEADNMRHLNDEEMVVMPELQRLYTDEELKAVEAKTYQMVEMTPEAMVGMMAALFPYMDVHDHKIFLEDIHQAAPEKFLPAFSGIAHAQADDGTSALSEIEVNQLMKQFSVDEATLMKHNSDTKLHHE
tara:strand:+ start:36900 stop:37469 length:570 start_codon:yes stop_codon:yes gene_type:complete